MLSMLIPMLIVASMVIGVYVGLYLLMVNHEVSVFLFLIPVWMWVVRCDAFSQRATIDKHVIELRTAIIKKDKQDNGNYRTI